MDDADLAGDRIEIETRRYLAAIDEAIKAQKAKLPATGYCHYCSDPAPPGRTFCSLGCSTDHAHEQQRKKDMGIP